MINRMTFVRCFKIAFYRCASDLRRSSASGAEGDAGVFYKRAGDLHAVKKIVRFVRVYKYIVDQSEPGGGPPSAAG